MVVQRLAGVLLLPVRTLTQILTGSGPSVDDFPKRVLVSTSVRRRKQGLSVVIVYYLRSLVGKPVVEDSTHFSREGNEPLAIFLVLQWRLGPVLNLQTLIFRMVILDVESVSTPDSDPRVPEKSHERVGPGGVLEPTEVVQQCLGLFGIEHGVTLVFSVTQRRGED